MVHKQLGTEEHDLWSGTACANRFVALAGNDRCFGRGGNDVISGGAGDDAINGDAGDEASLPTYPTPPIPAIKLSSPLTISAWFNNNWGDRKHFADCPHKNLLAYAKLPRQTIHSFLLPLPAILD